MESTPLTAAGITYWRERLLNTNSLRADNVLAFIDGASALLAERDALAADLESRRELGRIDQRRIAEARGIARALRVWAGEDGVAAPQGLLDEFDALALHWPDPQEQ